MGGSLKLCLTNKLPGDADAIGPQASFEVPTFRGPLALSADCLLAWLISISPPPPTPTPYLQFHFLGFQLPTAAV